MILNGIKRIFLKKALRPVTPPPRPPPEQKNDKDFREPVKNVLADFFH